MSSSTKITCAKALIVLLTMLIGLHTAGAQPFNAVIQKGHGEVVKSASFTVDGKYLVTVSRDKSAKIWDALSGKEIRTFLGHKHTLNAIAIHQERLATSSADGTAAVWDIKTGEMIWQSSNLGNYATSVAWSPNGKYLAIGGLVDSVHIYHGKALNLYKKIRTNPDNGVGYGVHLRFSGDGQLLAIGEDQRTTKIYSTTDWTLQRAFTPEVGYCGGCGTLSAFSPDDKYLLKLSNGTSFTKYEISTGNKIVAFDREMRDIMSTDFHSSGKYYLAATEDTIYLFNDSDVLLQSISLEGKINDARFHPLENQIVIALGKVTVLVDLTGKEVKRFQGILNTTTTGLDYDLGSYWEHHIAKWVKYKPARFFDNKTLFVGKTGYKGRKWEISSASIAMEYIGHEKGILCFERIDDKTIATGGGDGRIIIWDEMTGKVKKVITAHRQPIFDLQVSHDGQLLASCSWDGVINWWNTQNWDRYKYVYKEGASSYVAAFTKNDAYLVVGLLDKTLQLLEIETGRFVKEFVGHTDIVTSIEVKENEVLTASWDGSIIVWDLYSGLIKTRIKTEHPIFSAQWYEEGIISTGSDRQVSFWSADGMSVQKLKGHQSEINGLEISKDLMVTADVDGITKLWDLSKKQVLFEHIQIGKNDWMVKTPQGYFDATDAAISNIHFVRGMDVYGASQLMDKFYVPDLVEHLFASNKSSSSSMAK
ncbi:MAG: hypothetical protein KI790_18325, partial [Cyclobacteriaceae bacterium]|nr:hypothetical protein [Cyclobacteriaceae bacterium HetDA_MAG_MS6]